jgi:hypothetical protein
MVATINQPQPLSRRKRLLFVAIIWTVILLSFLFLSEIVLRWKVGPWSVRSPATQLLLEPAKNYYRKDAALGYLPEPGTFRITLPGPYSFRITHSQNGLRITRPLDTDLDNRKKEIWIFGCSFTEGWTLNDEETYPWVLQAQIKNYEVVNFGVGGYGTLQSLIQLREAVKNGKKPAVAVLSYASFHDRRNTLARSWMKTRMTYGPRLNLSDVQLPYMKWSANQTPELLYRPIEYHEVPFARYSALANTLDETYNRIVDQTYHDHDVSKAIIEEFAEFCRAQQIDFIVAGITSDSPTTEMLQYCKSRGMNTVDISVDLNIMANTNLPYDNHPSALADRHYAEKLRPVLCARLIDEPSCVAR